MQTLSKLTAIRAKKLGVLIKDARNASGKTLEDCAWFLNIPGDVFEQYESGLLSPSLPEIEGLAYYVNVPVEHFWGQVAISEQIRSEDQRSFEEISSLRHRIIGTLLRQARQDSGLSLATLAEKVDLSEDDLEAYESGKTPIPLPKLEVLAEFANKPLEVFSASPGETISGEVQQLEFQQELDLPDELLSFVTKPVNRPYLELAQRLSEMSVEKLRSVAEGLLEITL